MKRSQEVVTDELVVEAIEKNLAVIRFDTNLRVAAERLDERSKIFLKNI